MNKEQELKRLLDKSIAINEELFEIIAGRPLEEAQRIIDLKAEANKLYWPDASNEGPKENLSQGQPVDPPQPEESNKKLEDGRPPKKPRF